MNWNNKQDGCPLCGMADEEPEEQTHRYFEDEKVLIADNLEGHPFVVLKDHRESVTGIEKEVIRGKVESVFGDCDLHVKMNLVEDHWHAHISDPDADPDRLKRE